MAGDKILARIGMVASALAVFLCGWLAMKTSDWKRIVLFTLMAGGAALVAQAFSRRLR